MNLPDLLGHFSEFLQALACAAFLSMCSTASHHHDKQGIASLHKFLGAIKFLMLVHVGSQD